MRKNRTIRIDIIQEELNKPFPNIYDSRFDSPQTPKMELIGQGTFGHVYKIYDPRLGKYVAKKRASLIDPEDGSIDTWKRECTLLEVKCLRELSSHPNVNTLYRADTKQATYIDTYLEYKDIDLFHWIRMQEGDIPAHKIQQIMKDILHSVQYIHKNGWLHGDIKASNYLIDYNGSNVQLCDFGLAEPLSQKRKSLLKYTSCYRPPEIIHGCRDYGTPADLWAVGCIMAEMIQKNCVFNNRSNKKDFINPVLYKIYCTFGTPVFTETIHKNIYWKDLKVYQQTAEDRYRNKTQRIIQCKNQQNRDEYLRRLRRVLNTDREKNYFRNFKDYVFQKNRAKFTNDAVRVIGPLGLDLLLGLLTYDPKTRITTEQALKHPFFTQNFVNSRRRKRRMRKRKRIKHTVPASTPSRPKKKRYISFTDANISVCGGNDLLQKQVKNIQDSVQRRLTAIRAVPKRPIWDVEILATDETF